MEPELLLVLVSVTVTCCTAQAVGPFSQHSFLFAPRTPRAPNESAFIIGLQRWKTNTWETTPSLKLMTC